MNWKKISLTVGKWAGGIILAGIAVATTEYVQSRTKQALEKKFGKVAEEEIDKEKNNGLSKDS